MTGGHPIGRPVMAAFAVLAVALLASACVTVGREFPVAPVAQIAIGTTTQADIQRMFGEPWRVGIEDGQRTWTYGLYRYSVFAPANTRDLKIRFDAAGVVAAYTFDSTDRSDASIEPGGGT